jgi:3-oxoacyl-[acyl-carrier-protein] synthase II
MGVVTSLGHDVREVFDALCRGESGIRRIERFDVSSCPSKLGGIIEGFDPWQVIQDRAGRRLLRLADWMQAIGLCAAELAVRDAGLGAESVVPERLGVSFGAGRGGAEATDEMTRALYARLLAATANPALASAPGTYEHAVSETLDMERPTHFFKQCPCLLATYVGIRHGARGPTITNVNLCSAGAQAIGEAAWIVARDDADVMIAGGADSMLNLPELRAFCALDAVSTKNEDGPEACKPFDRRRDGCIVSEGAAALILEEREHARARGATIYAEVLGYGSSGDAYKVTAPAEDGSGAALAMRQALRHAGLAPEDVGHINAHGTATPLNDRIETRAIKTVFGPHAYRMPVSSTKSMTGHLIAAAGALEAVVSVRCLAEKRVPPTRNLKVPDPSCDLDYVVEGQRPMQALRAVLSNSFAIGGTNACLVFGEASAS